MDMLVIAMRDFDNAEKRNQSGYYCKNRCIHQFHTGKPLMVFVFEIIELVNRD
jgi:hypothetical protein